jgi:hypothetical protein
VCRNYGRYSGMRSVKEKAWCEEALKRYTKHLKTETGMVPPEVARPFAKFFSSTMKYSAVAFNTAFKNSLIEPFKQRAKNYVESRLETREGLEKKPVRHASTLHFNLSLYFCHFLRSA